MGSMRSHGAYVRRRSAAPCAAAFLGGFLRSSNSSSIFDVLHLCCCQSEALEELMGMENPARPATRLPRLLLEHRSLDKLLTGFVAVRSHVTLHVLGSSDDLTSLLVVKLTHGHAATAMATVQQTGSTSATHACLA
jgi:hypothetical protein